jgi:hypothetical protein
MINPVSSATQAQNVIQTASVNQKSAQPTPQPAAQPVATDTVQISSAAKAMQETNETPAQTVQEAGKGDHQAQRLLAREASERAILEGKV